MSLSGAIVSHWRWAAIVSGPAGNPQRMSEDLTSLDTHFAFGDNWRDFAAGIDEVRVGRAVASLRRLLPASEVEGRTVVDLGSGSGLSSLAALRLGAASVLALDLDPASVDTSSRLLSNLAADREWRCIETSVLDLSPSLFGQFDIVYSWGVLHHTGDMWHAAERAASLVAPGGTLVIALYHKTAACDAWRTVKRGYSRAPRWAQLLARVVYAAALFVATALHGTNAVRSLKGHARGRGMSFWHDVHDWLGGYPYESASPGDVHSRLEALGFEVRREFLQPQTRGWLGSGCDEYVFSRRTRGPSTESDPSHTENGVDDL